MRFFTAYENRPVLTGEYNDGVSKVQPYGYIPTRVQVQRMLEAGVRLSEFRKGLFDFDDDTPDDEIEVDPTRSPSFDLADASEAFNGLQARPRGKKPLPPESDDPPLPGLDIEPGEPVSKTSEKS